MIHINIFYIGTLMCEKKMAFKTTNENLILCIISDTISLLNKYDYYASLREIVQVFFLPKLLACCFFSRKIQFCSENYKNRLHYHLYKLWFQHVCTTSKHRSIDDAHNYITTTKLLHMNWWLLTSHLYLQDTTP